jgi:predicted TIM-barrel fold metal-dependent hydrolase
MRDIGLVEADERVTLVSVDCHAGPESMADYLRYAPPELRGELQDYVSRIDAFESEREAAGGGGGRGGAFTREDRGLWDISVRTARMHADGIVAEVVFPQGSVPFARYPAVGGAHAMEWVATPQQRDAGPAIYNRWLADFCSSDPDAHFGVAVLPIADVGAAAREVAVARESGIRGGISLPPVRPDLQYNERVYDRLWAACQDHEMVVNLHGGAGMIYRGGPETGALILCETDFFSHRALWYLIFGGVFERFPRLRLAITEQRAHWVPATLAELDSIYRSALCAALRAELPRLPSEYFATNCYIGGSFLSKPECDLRHDIGVDRIMWGSDYPHNEGVWPWVSEGLRWTFNGVDETDARMMLGANAVDCYGFDEGLLRERAAAVGPSVDGIVGNPIEAPPDAPGIERSWAFRTSPWA